MSGPHVVIMAGGTGGHVFPALAVARELVDRGASVSWLGTRAGLEAQLVPEAGFPIDYISIAGLRGKGALGWLMAPLRISLALLQALTIIIRRRADVVLGMGGFVTGPGGVAARLSGRPLLIHEQNAIPGLTNRLLSRIASLVMEAFPATFSDKTGVEQTGNPVRQAIIGMSEPATRYARHEGPIRLLVVGGSLGAKVLNEMVPCALEQMAHELRPTVIHQAGKSNIDEAAANYRKADVEADVRPFIDDMAEAYEWADLVLCRAGALTVSELAVAGLPGLLVPFPYAVDDHQTANAEYLVRAGAARLLQQDGLTCSRLAQLLEDFCREPVEGRQQLLAMANAARRVAVTDAAQRVSARCLDAAAGRLGEVEP